MDSSKPPGTVAVNLGIPPFAADPFLTAMKLSALFVALTTSLGLAAAHTWTATADGATLEARFVSLEGETLTLAITGGTTLSYPIDTFVEADRELARGMASGEIIVEGGVDVLGSVRNNLVKLDGDHWAPAPLPGQPRYIFLYYSASWCAPCRAAAPHNVELYHQLIAPRRDVAMIWVSADREPGPMLDWAVEESFPWFALPFDSLADHPLQKLAKNFVPYYLLVDPSGNKLAEGPEEVFRYLGEHPEAAAVTDAPGAAESGEPPAASPQPTEASE